MKQLFKLLMCLSLAAVLSSCADASGEAAKTNAADMEKNKEAMKTFFKSFESGDVTALDAIVETNFVEHTPPPDMEIVGLDGLKKMVKMNHDAFPDTKVTIHSMIAEGDLVMVHYNWKGTNTGAWDEKTPASNKAVDVDGVDLVKFTNGKASEHWGYFEEMKFMEQLGMMGNPTEEVVEDVKEITKEVVKTVEGSK